jgi:hypothetical protein
MASDAAIRCTHSSSESATNAPFMSGSGEMTRPGPHRIGPYLSTTTREF